MRTPPAALGTVAIGCLFAVVGCTDDEKAPIVIYGCDPTVSPTGSGAGTGTGSGAGSGTGSGSGSGSGSGGSNGNGGSDTSGGSSNAGSSGSGPMIGDWCAEPWSEPVDTSECDIANLEEDTSITLTGKITSDITLTSNKAYQLSEVTTVESGVTLTIEPCVKIVGQQPKATLAILPGAKIEAEGEPNKPIVFTSAQPPGQRAPGDWGGLLILGNAFTNKATTTQPAYVEGLEEQTEYGSHLHDNDDESSGTLAYARIEYAGREIDDAGNETNGLTMAGVGSGTVLHHIMVSNAFDDCFEWFGGTVNADHLIALNCDDDMYDADLGYSGKVQFAFGRQGAQTTELDSSGFELDTAASKELEENGAIERTTAEWSNVTLCGAPFNFDASRVGAVFRRGVSGSIENTIITGFSMGLSWRNPVSAPTISMSHSVVTFTAGMGQLYDSLNNNTDWILSAEGNSDNSVDPIPDFCNCWSNPPVPFPKSELPGATPSGFPDDDAAYVGAFKESTSDANWMNGAWVDWSSE
jgi:hypothetical protein